ncbi:MAG: indole-3-glycerol phosphate synthase TrpC [Lachnospiraceae bacterium]|nr:indole-3-glycerol phosphate synthase TrpC [Lachnospiraceae bacterium]
MTILDEIAGHAKKRVMADKEKVSLEALKELAEEVLRHETGHIQDKASVCLTPGSIQNKAGKYHSSGQSGNAKRSFRDAIAKPGLSFICEVKKASPSKGIIDPVFDYKNIANEYENAGADCISCLTEPKWFMGSDDIFREIRKSVDIPMLRKDFTIDEYQIYQAKVMGADCVLLICALLDTDTIARYLEICSSLRLDALVETHDENEIRSAVSAGAGIIGVNNRNLKDFSVNFDNAARLRDMIPDECLYVAESGVSKPEDAALLRKIGADAVLMGEVLMRSQDKKGLLDNMRKMAEKG